MSKNSAYYDLGNISGNHDVKELKKELAVFPGVISVSVNKETNRITVDYDSTGVMPEWLTKTIAGLGYKIISSDIKEHIM